VQQAFIRERLKEVDVKDFRAFILRGNVVDLAIGVVIGAAFGAIVTSLVNDVITPAISLLNLPDFSRAVFEAGDAGPKGDIAYGRVINAVISFLVIAAVIFFFVVRPLNRLTSRDKEEEPESKLCPHCLTSIPLDASVCSACGRDVAPKKTPARKR
jgi:large conductance mechanosensitive channel